MSEARTRRQDPPWRGSIDPVILQAAREVDPTLLDWALGLSPRERLRACSKATTALGKLRMSHPPRADLDALVQALLGAGVEFITLIAVKAEAGRARDKLGAPDLARTA